METPRSFHKDTADEFALTIAIVRTPGIGGALEPETSHPLQVVLDKTKCIFI